MIGKFNSDLIYRSIQKLLSITQRDGLPPVSIAITDKEGFLLFFTRMDGAPLRSLKLAQCKAYTSSRMGTTTEAFLLRLNNEQLDIGFFCDQELTALPGGTPVIIDNCIIGAIGISGRKPQDDQKLADKAVSLILNEMTE